MNLSLQGDMETSVMALASWHRCREMNSAALFMEMPCFSGCPLLYCKYSSFHFPKLGMVPEEFIWITFAHYPPQKRISQQGPYS